MNLGTMLLALMLVLMLCGRRNASAQDADPPPPWRAEVETLTTQWTGRAGAAGADAEGNFWLWGGVRAVDAGRGDIERFSPRKDAIDLVRCAGEPPPGTFVPALAIDQKDRRAFVFGGWAAGAKAPSDQLHILDLAQQPPRWQRVAPQGDWPPGRNGAALIWYGRASQLILFGGDAGPGTDFNALGDLWRFSGTAGRWTAARAKGDAPPARWHAMAAVDEAAGKMYLVGGAGLESFDRHLYELDLASDKWRRIESDSAAPPSLQGATLTFDSRRSLLVLCGGLRHEEPGPATSDEIWIFDCKSQRWHRLERDTPDLRRRDHVAAYDPHTDAHYLLGGHVSDRIGDFYRSGAPVQSILRLRIRSQGER